VDLVFFRVGSNRMGADGRCGVRVRAWRRSGVLDAQLGRRGAGKEIMIIAGIEPGFVGPALARNDFDGAATAIVDDQGVRAAAAEGKLVIRTDRKPRGPTQPVEVAIVNAFSTRNGASPEILTTTPGPGVASVPVAGMAR